MSIRAGAPYADRIEENGRVLVYEGHDAPKLTGGLNPKTVDQPMCSARADTVSITVTRPFLPCCMSLAVA